MDGIGAALVAAFRVMVTCGYEQSKAWSAPVKSYIFRVVVEDDATENGQEAFHAYCPALKGCHTWGRTYDEALANVREAV
jgi:hypothetical protein